MEGTRNADICHFLWYISPTGVGHIQMRLRIRINRWCAFLGNSTKTRSPNTTNRTGSNPSDPLQLHSTSRTLHYFEWNTHLTESIDPRVFLETLIRKRLKWTADATWRFVWPEWASWQRSADDMQLHAASLHPKPSPDCLNRPPELSPISSDKPRRCARIIHRNTRKLSPIASTG